MIEDDERGRGTGVARTLALSDGVFAIAMTLLAFQIQPPDLKGEQVHHLAGALGDLSSRYYVYALSFAVIGLFWLAHHRLFNLIERVDDAMLLANLAFLMVIAALPFPSAVLGRYSEQRTAVVLYASAMTVAGALTMSLLLIAKRHKLLSPTVRPAEIGWALWRSGSTAAVFALSVPVAIVAPGIATYTWIAVLVVRLVPSPRGQRAGLVGRLLGVSRPAVDKPPPS